jgi:hypothetical protein
MSRLTRLIYRSAILQPLYKKRKGERIMKKTFRLIILIQALAIVGFTLAVWVDIPPPRSITHLVKKPHLEHKDYTRKAT